MIPIVIAPVVSESSTQASVNGKIGIIQRMAKPVVSNSNLKPAEIERTCVELYEITLAIDILLKSKFLITSETQTY